MIQAVYIGSSLSIPMACRFVCLRSILLRVPGSVFTKAYLHRGQHSQYPPRCPRPVHHPHGKGQQPLPHLLRHHGPALRVGRRLEWRQLGGRIWALARVRGDLPSKRQKRRITPSQPISAPQACDQRRCRRTYRGPCPVSTGERQHEGRLLARVPVLRLAPLVNRLQAVGQGMSA